MKTRTLNPGGCGTQLNGPTRKNRRVGHRQNRAGCRLEAGATKKEKQIPRSPGRPRGDAHCRGGTDAGLKPGATFKASVTEVLAELAEFFAVGDKIGIRAAAELVEIETLPFTFQGHALRPDSIQSQIQAVGDRQDKTDQRGNS